MKRSEINGLMREAVGFLEERRFPLPPFAFWGPGDWKTRGPEYDGIRDSMLGWDITDFGGGDFAKVGLLLFTLRNGGAGAGKGAKPYAEKIMIVQEEQVTPFHFHWSKMEDIINRGGGRLLVRLYNSTAAGGFDGSPVRLAMDGRNFTVDAGDTVAVRPGESITLPAGQYHEFRGEKGTGRVLLGEVSMVNDDRTDNRFHDPIGRFPAIDEDCEPLYLLGSEYPPARR
ncbi:MAG: D-lyxose/D-mannose family sugar isomerase [Candidatus Coatesbacteria bacterium]